MSVIKIKICNKSQKKERQATFFSYQLDMKIPIFDSMYEIYHKFTTRFNITRNFPDETKY